VASDSEQQPYRSAPVDVPLCPRCRTPLSAVEHEGEEIAGCIACGGFFVDGDVLARIVERHRPSEAPPPSLRPPVSGARPPIETRVVYLACPRCGATMNRGVFGRKSGVIVDTCRVHGTWFDAHELEACEAYVEAGGLDVAERLAREERARLARAARVAYQSQFTVQRSTRHLEPVEDRDWIKLLDVLTRL
jgi:Zn-finger nucleic acid-binding protein